MLQPHSKTYQWVFNDNILFLEKVEEENTYRWSLNSHPAYKVTFTDEELNQMIQFLMLVRDAK